ncbi:MAG: hypothetical protein ACRDHF_04475 [Tepidiformaceae bacterium]
MSEAASIAISARLDGGAPATVLALHCGERGPRGAFDELIGAVAPGSPLERIVIPGGAWWLAQAAELTEGRIKRIVLGGRHPVRDVMDSFLDSSALELVVLAGHQGCSWYRRRYPRHSAGELVREQGADMLRARDEVERWAGRRLAVTGWILLADASGQASGRRLF